MAIQTEYGKPDPAEPYKPESVEVVTGDDGRKHLVLQVKIEGRLRRVLLSTDDVQDHGMTGPGAVEELRGIREQLSSMADLHVKAIDLLSDFPKAIAKERALRPGR